MLLAIKSRHNHSFLMPKFYDKIVDSKNKPHLF
jgi:hypothetical protein